LLPPESSDRIEGVAGSVGVMRAISDAPQVLARHDEGLLAR
jgi:hypothetical protein